MKKIEAEEENWNMLNKILKKKKKKNQQKQKT